MEGTTTCAKVPVTAGAEGDQRMTLGDKLVLGAEVTAKELRDAGQKGLEGIPDHAILSDSQLEFQAVDVDHSPETINSRQFNVTMAVKVVGVSFAWEQDK